MRLDDLAPGTTLRLDGRTCRVLDAARDEHGAVVCLLEHPAYWSAVLVCGFTPGEAELYALEHPASVVRSQLELARERVRDEDAFWAEYGDTDAVIGELAPAEAPPSSAATLAHDDVLATDRLMAGVLYDLQARRFWIVREVRDYALADLGIDAGPARRAGLAERLRGRLRRG